MLKNAFDLVPRHAREPFKEIVHGCTVFDVLKQCAHRHASALKHPCAANPTLGTFNAATAMPLNHHAVMVPLGC